MSADKRALDDLDALFRAVPAQAASASASRPVKRPRSGRANPLTGSQGAAQSKLSETLGPDGRVAAVADRERERGGWHVGSC